VTARDNTLLPMAPDPQTGEVARVVDAERLLHAAGIFDVREASFEQIGTFHDNAKELRSIAAEADNLVGQEVIRRLDRGGKWTRREGGYEFNAPSPEAGTVAYDTDALRKALDDLMADDLIDVDASNAALEPTYPTVALNWDDLDVIHAGLYGCLDPGDWRKLAEKVEALRDSLGPPSYKQRPAGIKALLKRGGVVKAAIEACQREVQPPVRKARITALKQEAAA
jgi:hypothetical protein